MLALISRLLDWFRSLFWKEEMELTLVGLQYSGKTTFVNVIAVSVRPGSAARGSAGSSPRAGVRSPPLGAAGRAGACDLTVPYRGSGGGFSRAGGRGRQRQG